MLCEHGAHLTLSHAAEMDDLAQVRARLQAGADANTPDKSNVCFPLYWALSNGDHAMLDLLLAHGANPNLLNHPPTRIQGLAPLAAAIESGDRYALHALLARGADPGRASNRYSSSDPAHPAEPYSPLALAVSFHPEMIPELLAAGAEINAYNGAPLRSALRSDRPAIVQELLRRGARGNPPHIETAGMKPEPSLLAEAVKYAPDCLDALVRAGASLAEDRETILVTAATSRRPELFPKLIALGADVNGFAGEETPLTQSILYAPAGVKVLLDHGANPNGVRKSFRTPLAMAVQSRQPEVIRLLLAHGADVNLVPSHSHSALYYARKLNDTNLITLLQQAGATVDR
jgi:ankyrin repeat protein